MRRTQRRHMPRIEFDMDTFLPPDKVIAMLTDFSEQRPDTWPGLPAAVYHAYSVGDKMAEIREGNEKPNIWNRQRYDWSTPGRVRCEVVESNFCTPGNFEEYNVQPRDPAGSRLHVTWQREPTTLKGRIVISIVALTQGAILKASLNKGLKKAEKEVPPSSR
jgi:hypothetical protein